MVAIRVEQCDLFTAYHRRSQRRKHTPIKDWKDNGIEPDVIAILKGAPTQQRAWDYIDSYKTKWNGNPPTRQQIATHLDCSKQRVDRIIEILEEKEVITLDELLRPMIYWKDYGIPQDVAG